MIKINYYFDKQRKCMPVRDTIRTRIKIQDAFN